MKLRKRLLFELVLFIVALVYVAGRDLGVSLALVLMFFTFGLIVLHFLDVATANLFPADLESQYDFKAAYEAMVDEVAGANEEVKQKVKIINFEEFKRWE